MTSSTVDAAWDNGTQAMEGTDMAEGRKSRGLCCACNCEAHCTHTRAKETPVLQCEEFEPCECPPCKPRARREKHLPEREEVLAADDGLEARGLCVNCDNRRGCAFPKPPGGVWHCIEYR